MKLFNRIFWTVIAVLSVLVYSIPLAVDIAYAQDGFVVDNFGTHTPLMARMNVGVLGGGVAAAGGPAPGTLLLGNSNTTTSTQEFNGNPNTAYYMCHAAAASATVAHAHFYDRLGAETDPVHVCIWENDGNLLGCSGNIVMTGAAGWRSVDWSGPALTAPTTYCIGFVSGTTTGMWTNYDTSSPTILQCVADATGQTFGSEADVPVCDTEGQIAGSFTIYVTN